MHEVEPAGHLVGDQVHRADLQVRRGAPVEQPGVEVDGQHMPAPADPGGQPPGDRAGTGTRLQAPPAFLDTGMASTNSTVRIRLCGATRCAT